jgi:DNA-binding transcriptional ArsR family regulator
MEKIKKKSSKDLLFEDISSSVKKLTSAGAVQLPNFNPKQYADKLKNDSNSLWENKPQNVPGTQTVPDTNIVPGTDNVPKEIVPGSQNVPGTQTVPDTNIVPGTVIDDTDSVPGTVIDDTDSVPGTVIDGSQNVPGTQTVPDTNIVPGTDYVPMFFDSLINTLSNSERVILLKRIIHLPVSPTSKLVLIIFLNTINKAKQKVSLRSISREYKLRWATLLESLASLEEEEIVKADHKKDGTVIDIENFLSGTVKVPDETYVCSMLNINNNTNNKHTSGTDRVSSIKNFEKRILESNIRLTLGLLEMMEVTTDGRNKKSGFSRAIANIIKESSKDERKMENVLSMAVKAREAAKSNKSGYFVKLCKEMDTDEITEEMIKEVNKLKNVYHVVINKEFDNPSLDELKEYAKKLGETHFPNNRVDLVDYLTERSNILQESVRKRQERMKEWGIL